MAAAIAQSIMGSGAENPSGVAHPTATFGSAVASGNTIVVGSVSSKNATQIAPTDNVGNTYHQACLAGDGSGEVVVWYAYNVTGSSSLTVTASDPQGCCCGPQTADGIVGGYELSGVTTTDPLDKTATLVTLGSSSPSVSTAATTQANELVLAFLGGINITGTPTVATGSGFGSFLSRVFTEGSGAKLICAAEAKSVAATGAQTGAFTITNFDRSYLAVATFKAAGSTTALPIQPLIACRAVTRAAVR